ncbi:hypothetical protein QF047_001766 [Arthrobacter sp. W4I7]|nr:hypothetical protein [Arthrobacter sp. W4I7]
MSATRRTIPVCSSRASASRTGVGENVEVPGSSVDADYRPRRQTAIHEGRQELGVNVISQHLAVYSAAGTAGSHLVRWSGISAAGGFLHG